MSGQAMDTGAACGASSFLDLLGVHDDLVNEFGLHQQALVALDIPAATEHLRVFGGMLRRHIADEEEILFPMYVRVEPLQEGGIGLYLKEHERMLRLLERFEEAMLSLREMGPDRSAWVVEILEHESRFKGLVRHHDERERNVLYPALDRATTAAERLELIGRCFHAERGGRDVPAKSAPEAASAYLHVAVAEGVATIEFDRPPLNVLNIDMLKALNAELDRINNDASVRVVVMSARGKAFSAGVEVAEHLPDTAGEMLQVFRQTVRLLGKLRMPTIAAVHGAALGGGCEIALCCDIVIAAESARFGQPEIQLAVIPPAASALMPRLCGFRKAMELILTGEAIDAHEAVRIGLANRAVADESLADEVAAFVGKLAGLSGPALRVAKKAVVRGLDVPFNEGFDAANSLCLDMLLHLGDSQEGLNAFLEKRAPNWRHGT